MEKPMIPDNPEGRLTRTATAAALTAAGFPIRPATLATKATRGVGRRFSGSAPGPYTSGRMRYGGRNLV